MPWKINQLSADFSQNRPVVVFWMSAGGNSDASSVNVSFPLGDNNKPPPPSVDSQALIAQAKQIVTDVANTAESKAPKVTATARAKRRR